MRVGCLLTVGLLVAAGCLPGCSVPRRPGIDKDVKRLEASHRAAAELADSDPKGALPKLEAVEAEALSLVERLLIGDPRRDTVDKVLAEARGRIREIARATGEGEGAAGTRLEMLARLAHTALEQGRDSRAEVQGRPASINGDMSLIDRAVGSTRKEASKVARRADVDFDRPGMGRVSSGERKGDVDLDEFDKRGKKKKKPKPRVKYTLPVTVQRVDAKGRFVVVYLVFLSKGSTVQVGSVTGNVLDAKGNTIASTMGAYLAVDFKPNWDDIYESQGKWITPESGVKAEADKPLFLAAVGHSPKAKQAKSAKMTVTTPGGHFRGRGP